jgi:FtsZ-binding cell division protein ZapB
VKELNKTIQYLKMEVETIKKSQRVTTMETKSLGKKSGTIEEKASATEYKKRKRESQVQKIP